MSRVVFHPEAEAEFIAAARFYEAQGSGLGVDFIREVRRALSTIMAYPHLGHRFSRRSRRFLVRQFPYGLLYRLEPDEIFVVAVAHLRRGPAYWRRIGSGRPG